MTVQRGAEPGLRMSADSRGAECYEQRDTRRSARRGEERDEENSNEASNKEPSDEELSDEFHERGER